MRGQRRRVKFVAAGLVLLLAGLIGGTLLAAPAIVITKDGQTFDGDVSEVGNSIHITIHGVTTVIPKSGVAEIRYRGDYTEEFRKRMSRLAMDDVAGRITLAREAFDQRRYDLAREALNDAIRVDPNSPEAYEILALVQRQMQLEQAGAAPLPARQPDATAPPTTRPAPLHSRLLSADQINIIRQYELKATDNGVRITFQGDVRKAFADMQKIPFAEFTRRPPVQQALDIIQNGTEAMRGQIRIATDPSSLAEWKRVQPMILSGCATTGCHGGPAGGALTLFSPAETDPLAYTNFFILQQYQKQVDPGDTIFGGGTRMIDRGHADDSLLASYGLPASISRHDHPPVGGRPINAMFRGTNDPRYEQLARWINQTLRPIQPNYGIELPHAPPATRPAHETPPAPSPATQPES